MHGRNWILALVVCLSVAPSLSAQRKSPVTVPDGTRVSAIKFEDESAVDLKPEEQVAFLFVSGIWNLEGRCLEPDVLGRLATIRELVTGVKTPVGETLGLSISPVKDTNYNYDLTIIGPDCLIRANPRVAGLGGFALMGSPKRVMGDFFYNPKGGDLSAARKLGEMGYGGSGFVR
jgi:hypothetical protein